jgi:putative transposase
MVRPLRIEFEGAFYHVINRGNAGEDLFISRYDRERFYAYLGKAVERYGIKIHAYCLMTNHYHLLVETPQANLSRTMKWINVSYAAYFNRKRNRKGHLFQGRFKSILVQADEYLKHLSRYIHLNPLRAGMVNDISAYEWSSYPALSGRINAPKWLETSWLLGLFGSNRKKASQRYRDFVEKAAAEVIENPANDLVGGFILGDEGFVDWVKQTFLSAYPIVKEVPQIKKLNRCSIKSVVTAVCDEYGCDAEQILSKGKKKNVARDIAIYLARDLTDESGLTLGKYFGNISGAGITVRYNHMVGQLAENPRLKGRVERIRKGIIK